MTDGAIKFIYLKSGNEPGMVSNNERARVLRGHYSGVLNDSD